MRIPKKALLLAVQRGIDPAEAFSTTLYTGNGGTQTVTNGINLAGEGGLVWTKRRSSLSNHQLFDTERGVINGLSTSTDGSAQNYPDSLTAFNEDGFGLGSWAGVNSSGETYVSWAFCQAPKFFDIVQYTGDGTSVRQIAHDLGVAPGMVVIKRRDTTSQWTTRHLSASGNLYLNLTNDQEADFNHIKSISETDFTVGSAPDVNISGSTYVAYLFAHDPSDSGIIQCGSYTGNGSPSGTLVDLGWRPQYVLCKVSSGAGDWRIYDSVRGEPFDDGREATLYANLSDDENYNDWIDTTSSGFYPRYSSGSGMNQSGETYIYMAIRAPE